MRRASQPSSKETCSSASTGSTWREGVGRRWRPLFPSLPISLKCCREGNFLLPGAALTWQVCASSLPRGCPTLLGRRACCSAQITQRQRWRVLSSEFNQAFFSASYLAQAWFPLEKHHPATPTTEPPSVHCANWNTNQRKKLSSVWTNCYRFTPSQVRAPDGKYFHWLTANRLWSSHWINTWIRKLAKAHNLILPCFELQQVCVYFTPCSLLPSLAHFPHPCSLVTYLSNLVRFVGI